MLPVVYTPMAEKYFKKLKDKQLLMSLPIGYLNSKMAK
jgi:hypothetical protein